MSVWCSRFIADESGFADDKPGPLVYHRSHIIPSLDGERGGSVDTAHLPAFIRRGGYDVDEGDGLSWWPFLRLSVAPVQRPSFKAWERLHALAGRLAADDPVLAVDVAQAADAETTVVLDRDQVVALVADLTAWLAGVDEDLT